MFSLRGDAHKIFLSLKKSSVEDPLFTNNKNLKQIAEIQDFYQSIESETLKKVYYCMIKEKNGSGAIPIIVSSAPWLLLLFSTQLQNFLFRDGSLLWIYFVFIYLILLLFSVFLHYHENSWASVHIEIIQSILNDRKEKNTELVPK